MTRAHSEAYQQDAFSANAQENVAGYRQENSAKVAPRNLTHSQKNEDNFQGKKQYAVESYFRDRKFMEACEQLFNNLIHDFKVCASKQNRSAPQMSLFFVNALADPARDFFFFHCSLSTLFDEIVALMRCHYNSETRKLQLQSEIDSLDLGVSMQKNEIRSFSDG